MYAFGAGRPKVLYCTILVLFYPVRSTYLVVVEDDWFSKKTSLIEEPLIEIRNYDMVQ